VTGRYDVCVRYYRVKRKLLDVGELHEWDRYAPVGEATRNLTWDDAKELVLGSYSRFSPRAGKLVEQFFKDRWIDAPVVPGKQGGAYCMPVTPHHHPYVLMNFTGKLRDALTLAHELGHGLHDRLASHQHVFDYHPPLTLAETASVFGDALTLTDEHKVWWSYVGHFLHTPGYVYAYAFGNLLALSVYHRFLEVGPSFVDTYLDFLGAGGSTQPDELVRRIGMDITDPG